jgi:hypothetical protein
MVTLGRGEHGEGVREDSRASDGVVPDSPAKQPLAVPRS